MKTTEAGLIRSNKVHKRYFILKNGLLYKKKNPDDKTFKAIYQLENYKIRHQSTEVKDPLAFDLVHPTDTQTFLLQSAAEKQVSLKIQITISFFPKNHLTQRKVINGSENFHILIMIWILKFF